MSFPRYERYKDSGVEWLGEVPEHWRITPFSYGVSFQEGPGILAIDFQEDGIPLLRISGIQERWATLEGCNFLDPEKVNLRWNHFRLKAGDLLISASASMGNICEVRQEAEGAIPYTGIIRLWKRGNITISCYVRALVNSVMFTTQVDLLKAGATIQHFGPTHLNRMKIVLPPVEEQKFIATFLDRETAKIDALVAEQQRLIELLKEKRQAVISHAVTKGLDPDVPMKDSGVECLGELPEHWEIKRLGFICQKIGSGKTPLGGSATYIDNGILFIRSQNVYDEGLRIDDVVYISEQTDSEMSSSRVSPGDILLNITGASLGRTCLVPDDFVPANVNQHVCIIRLVENKLRSYIAMVMKSNFIKMQIDASQNGAAREGLNFEQISKLSFGFPPVDEQAQIVAFLDSETAKLDTLTVEAQRAITLLQERRTALISAAVTGKIDVRGLISDKLAVE